MSRANAAIICSLLAIPSQGQKVKGEGHKRSQSKDIEMCMFFARFSSLVYVYHWLMFEKDGIDLFSCTAATVSNQLTFFLTVLRFLCVFSSRLLASCGFGCRYQCSCAKAGMVHSVSG